MITGHIVKNFSLQEMACKQNGDYQLLITPEMVNFAQLVQILRDKINKPIKVNSWFRTEHYNKMVGGARYSKHLDGRAVDIASTEYDKITRLWQTICQNNNKIGVIIYYDTFIHISDFGEKSGHKQFTIIDFRKQRSNKE